MIICVSGLTGSGKTTVGKLLSDRLGIRQVSMSYKEFATGDQLVSFIRRVKPSFDRAFDRRIMKEAAKADSVVSTSLGPWIIKGPSLNVWLNASLAERTRRVAALNRMTLKAARSYIEGKDGTWISHVRKAYGIDLLKDHGVFDMEINTERLRTDETVSLISTLSMAREGKRFR
jgi:CMP/dCMP kinase